MAEEGKPSVPEIPFPYRGVFSEIGYKTVGFGGTKRKEKIKKFYLFERDAQGSSFMRELGPDFLPVGKPDPVDIETALEDLFPEPKVYMERVAPRLAEMERLVDDGDEHRSNDELISAEFAYESAMDMDDYHIRANFGIGMTYLQMGNQEKATLIFEKLVSVDTTFSPEHKHLFNEFGIRLRKAQMYMQCLEYYGRAERLAKEDDHLYFNIARVHFDLEDYPSAARYVEKALGLNADFIEAIKMRAALVKHGWKQPEEADTDILSPEQMGADDLSEAAEAPEG